MMRTHFIFCSIICFAIFGCEFGKLSAQESEENPQQLYIQEFPMPPGILTSDRSEIPEGDPFAAPTKAETIRKKPNLNRKVSDHTQKVFEDAGITFPAGAYSFFDRANHQLVVINTEEQLDLVEIYFSPLLPDPVEQIHIFVEYIEVEAALYHDWMFENRITGDGTPLRKQAQKWVKSGDATHLDTAIVTARSGQRAKTESISEVIYPTTTVSSRVPNTVLLEGKTAKAPVTGVSGSNIETRHVGTTLEVDPIVGADNLTIDLNLSPEIVKRNGFTHWPPEDGDPLFTVSMPRFHTMKITTQVTLHHGHYGFLGTTKPQKAAVEDRKDPLVMTFVRGDISILPELKTGPPKRRPFPEKK